MDTAQKKAYTGNIINFYCWVPHKIIVSKRCRYAITISPPELEYGVFIKLMSDMLEELNDKDDRWIFVVERSEAGRYHMHGLYFNNKVNGPANSEVMKERFKDYCFVDIKKCFDVNGWLKYMFKEVKNDERPLCVTYQNKDKGLKYIKKSPSIFSKECRINSFGDITYERNGWISIHQLTSVIDDVELLTTHYLAVIEDIKKSKKSDLKE